MSLKYNDSQGNVTDVSGLATLAPKVGDVRYNNGSVEYYNGTTWEAISVGGGGVFPDYNQKIATIGNVHSYTAPKDCFLCGTYINASGDIGMFINGNCAYKAGTSVCVLLHQGDVVTAGAPSTDYRFKVDSTYYVNPLATFEIAE